VAKSKKGARNIVVHDVRYRWRAMGRDAGISLKIWPDTLPGPVIASGLGYHQKPIPLGNGAYALTQQIIITNRLVRQVIELAVEKYAYDPSTPGTQLNLWGIDPEIDLSIALRAS
jgi:hypothetical protein